MKRVLLTGAFGNVGANTVAHLAKQEYEIVAFDMKNPRNEKSAARLAQKYRFTTIWGDLRSAESVQEAVARAQPHAILHIGAIIAPTAYTMPEVAYDVNVNGTRHLLEAAQSSPAAPHLIFTSSYTVHGPRNPHRDPAPLTGDTPVNPGDTYGRHKVAGEEMVQESNLPWTIIRLPAVLATAAGWGQSDEFLKFAFLLPLARRQHTLDSRDAGVALTHAIDNRRAVGRMLNVGGPESDSRVTGEAFIDAINDARGTAIPASAFRVAHPDVDESWYYEDWVDTRESQEILHYQRHTFADHLSLLKRQAGFSRTLLKLIFPLIRGRIVKDSPFYGEPPVVNNETVWELVCRTFGVDRNQR